MKRNLNDLIHLINLGWVLCKLGDLGVGSSKYQSVPRDEWDMLIVERNKLIDELREEIKD